MTAVVVIPTYNEAGNVRALLEQILHATTDTDILIVDDNSPDGTAAIAESYEDGRVHVLNRPQREGLGVAYKAGFAWALERNYDVIAGMDADLSHDPAMLPELTAACADADLVIGSRYVDGGSIENWSLARKLLSHFGNRYARLLLGVKVNDFTSGFRAYRAETITALMEARLRADGYGFLIECVYRVSRRGGRIAELPITFRDRTWGASKMRPRTAIETFVLVTLWAFRRVARR